MIDELGLNETEREVLGIAQQLHTLTLHSGWAHIRQVMRQWEQEALRNMEECLSSDDRVRSNLQMRWEERVRLNRMLDVYLASIGEQRKALIREIAESKGNTPDEAFDLAEQL